MLLASALLVATAAATPVSDQPAEPRDEQSVRIAVGRFRGALTISGPDHEVTGGDGTRYRTAGPVVLAAGPRGIHLAGQRIPNEILRVRSPKELSLRGHQYRRYLEVTWRSYRGRPELLVVHPLPMETYVAGIVGSELPHAWPYEAMKAQAIAARTYAIWQKYRRLDLPYHMESSVLDQVYHGAQREHPEAERAAAETRGVILAYARRPAQAYFHAACGGHTESAAKGWGNELAYLPGSECGFCEAAPRYSWRATITRAELDDALHKVLGARPESVRIVKKSKTGRALSVVVTGGGRRKRITGADLRRLVGYTELWSTLITRVEETDEGWVFRGRGAGHGVGMCQWGARGMAKAGKTAEEILDRYYPGADRVRMY